MAEHWNGGNGGKGSKPRPYSVSQDELVIIMTLFLVKRQK
jgi:hypothetical protein